jgi:hypothetical protein
VGKAVWLGTGEEVQASEPLEQQMQGARSQGTRMLGKGRTVNAPGVKKVQLGACMGALPVGVSKPRGFQPSEGKDWGGGSQSYGEQALCAKPQSESSQRGQWPVEKEPCWGKTWVGSNSHSATPWVCTPLKVNLLLFY